MAVAVRARGVRDAAARTEAPIRPRAARDEVQPRVEVIRHDELRERERDEAEREDADVCVAVTIRPEQRRVPGRAALADEVGGDDRLAVPGRERVGGAPEHAAASDARITRARQVRAPTSDAKPRVGDAVGRLSGLPLESAGGTSRPGAGATRRRPR
jgi:hypothetical protein